MKTLEPRNFQDQLFMHFIIHFVCDCVTSLVVAALHRLSNSSNSDSIIKESKQRDTERKMVCRRNYNPLRLAAAAVALLAVGGCEARLGTTQESSSSSSPSNDELQFLKDCNANLHTAPCDTLTWSTLFGTKYHHKERVVIPCGHCVTLDTATIFTSSGTSQEHHHSMVSLILEGGLDVQGKLVVNEMTTTSSSSDESSAAFFNIITKDLIVEGELHLPGEMEVVTSNSGLNPGRGFNETRWTTKTIEITILEDDGTEEEIELDVVDNSDELVILSKHHHHDHSEVAVEQNSLKEEVEVEQQEHQQQQQQQMVRGGGMRTKVLRPRVHYSQEESTTTTMEEDDSQQQLERSSSSSSSSIRSKKKKGGVIIMERQHNQVPTKENREWHVLEQEEEEEVEVDIGYSTSTTTTTSSMGVLLDTVVGENDDTDTALAAASELPSTVYPWPKECQISNLYKEEDGIILHYDFASTTKHDIFASYDKLSGKNSDVSPQDHANDYIAKRTLRKQVHTASSLGPEVSLKDIQPCLQMDRPYLVTAQIKITSPIPLEKKDKLQYNDVYPTSMCKKSKKYCVEIMTASNSNEGSTTSIVSKWIERASHEIHYNQVYTIATTMKFTNKEMKLLFRNGPPKDEKGKSRIQLLDFTIRVPPYNAFRDIYNETDLCNDLVPPNGNAELVGYSPFPFATNNPFTHLVVEREDNEVASSSSSESTSLSEYFLDSFGYGNRNNVKEDKNANHYFSVKGRSHSIHAFDPDHDEWESAGLTWDVPLSCMNQPHHVGTIYKLHADVRIHSDERVLQMFHGNPSFDGIQLMFSIRAHKFQQFDDLPSSSKSEDKQLEESHEEDTKEDDDYYQSLMVCNPSWDTWVSCDGQLEIPPEFQDPSIVRYEVLLTTLDTYRVNYDVDNLSMIKQPQV